MLVGRKVQSICISSFGGWAILGCSGVTGRTLRGGVLSAQADKLSPITSISALRFIGDPLGLLFDLLNLGAVLRLRVLLRLGIRLSIGVPLLIVFE